MDLKRTIDDILAYAVDKRIIEPQDERWATNVILGMLDEPDFQNAARAGELVPLMDRDDDLGCELLGRLMPRPSEMAAHWCQLLREDGPQAATDWFYQLSCDVDYVKRKAMARNLSWETRTK